MKDADDLLQALALAFHVETAFSGQLLTPFGHQCDEMRFDVHRHPGHLVRCRHLEIQLGLNNVSQEPEVSILDVPSVLA